MLVNGVAKAVIAGCIVAVANQTKIRAVLVQRFRIQETVTLSRGRFSAGKLCSGGGDIKGDRAELMQILSYPGGNRVVTFRRQ